ncbi:hypothetical protein ACQCX2_17435 [Propionibacteriaceae bacterium Y1700]|uniref:hypothetical protein n=1 Tax=Microlunatus sp. Y1700 TaxID=3418487 RepID=UPI003DA7830C
MIETSPAQHRHRSRRRTRTAAGLTASAVMIATTVLAVPMAPTASAAPEASPDLPHGVLVQEFPGDLDGPYREQFLAGESGSTAETELPHIASWPAGQWDPRPYATKRWADGHDWFSYRLPVPAETSVPLRLTMITKGEVGLTVDGETKINTGNSGEGGYTPREVQLDDPAVWADGVVELRFFDADPSDGWGPNLYDLELGSSSSLEQRIAHLQWNSQVEWYAGLPDGTGNEFVGSSRDLTVGAQPYTALARSGTITLRWDQEVRDDRRYILMASAVGRQPGGWSKLDGPQTVDLGADGSVEADRRLGGERVIDLDITDRVRSVGNVVKLTIPDAAQYDFVTVVSTPADGAQVGDLPFAFGGNEQAEHFTQLANTSMFFTTDMLNDKNSGFIDSSMINGIFANTLFVADFGPAIVELLKAGEVDRAREALAYLPPDETGHYQQDIAAGNLIFSTRLGILRADNYSQASKQAHWATVRGGMARIEELINATPYHLVKGTNAETSGDSQGIYASGTSYYTLLAAAEAADRLGETADRDRWRAAAATLAQGMDEHLVWDADASWLGQPMAKGTWKYGLTDDGRDPDRVLAGWQSIGSAKDIFHGLAGDDAQWRDRTDRTLDHHMAQFWSHWRTTGNNKGFGTDYGVLSERGGWPLNSLLEGDRIADATKNLNHVVFNSHDHNFAPVGKNTALVPDNEADYSEWSPHLIIRETDPDDRGSSNLVGNGAGSEDLNLVEYILFLKNARIMAGVDDQLPGDENLRVVPRLPLGWTTASVHDWPVSHRVDGGFGRTTLSYDYRRTPKSAEMTLRAGAETEGVPVRLGPFAKSATLRTATVDGAAVEGRVEDSGDSRWVWVTAELDQSDTTVAVQMDDSGLVATPALPEEMTGWTLNGGSWTGTGDRATVQTEGDAWAINPGVDASGVSMTAAVNLAHGNAQGVSVRTNADGSQGYDLILDRQDGKIKIARRPYEVLASAAVPVALDRTYQLRLEARGDTLIGYLDGVQVLSVTDPTYDSGHVGLFAYRSTVGYASVEVRS